MHHIGSILRHFATSAGAVGLYEAVDWQALLESNPDSAAIFALVFAAGFFASIAKNKKAE